VCKSYLIKPKIDRISHLPVSISIREQRKRETLGY